MLKKLVKFSVCSVGVVVLSVWCSGLLCMLM